MTLALNKLSYTDLPIMPKTGDVELSRYYAKLADIFKRMSGDTTTPGNRIITLDDLNDSLFRPSRWRDYNVGAVTLGTAASAPDLVAYNGSTIMMPAFDGSVTTEQLYGSIELNHDYEEGTDIFFHVHWAPTTATAGNVVWQLEYTMLRSGLVSTATTIRRQEASPAVAWKMLTTELPKIDGTNLKLGDQFVFRLFRNPTYNSGGLNDTYPADVVVATVGLHVQVDGLGSKRKSEKN